MKQNLPELDGTKHSQRRKGTNTPRTGRQQALPEEKGNKHSQNWTTACTPRREREQTLPELDDSKHSRPGWLQALSETDGRKTTRTGRQQEIHEKYSSTGTELEQALRDQEGSNKSQKLTSPSSPGINLLVPF
jgi:hypothetical protein